jgi:DNA primase
MNTQPNLLELAEQYHASLPPKIRTYLNARGIPDDMIDRHLLGWSGWRITIPIADRDGTITFFKYAKDPDDQGFSPKMLASRGARLELYGWETLLAKPTQIIICEGEFDRLVLEARGFHAVTSTGGAGAFREAWAADFAEIPDVYVCFDRDAAGSKGAIRVATLIPHAKIVELPETVGESGDVTDFFVRLGESRESFIELLAGAKPAPPSTPSTDEPAPGPRDPAVRDRTKRIKQAVPIADLIGRYIHLRESGHIFFGICPFHADRLPSLAVYPETGRFYCFGCLKRGDVIAFIREMEHLTFNEALDRLERMPFDYGRNAA